MIRVWLNGEVIFEDEVRKGTIVPLKGDYVLFNPVQGILQVIGRMFDYAGNQEVLNLYTAHKDMQ